MLALAFLFIFFFSSDFGLIDVEKTSIITAFAIDKDGEKYSVSAQIAVPEATDTNSENQKALLFGTGSTIGAAIKDLGDVSGWYPKLSFCNLIIIGEEFSSENVITILDYFAKTLRIQDSALVAFAEGKASELLEVASPLDNISSFAIQKVLLKTHGFDTDIANTNIKNFCSGYYSQDGSSFMPIIKKTLSSGNQSSGQGGNASSSGNGGNGENGGQSNEKQGETKTDGKYLFNAKTTAIFKDGIKVGELKEEQTLVFNAITKNITGTTLPVDDVEYDGGKCNYLLNVLATDKKIELLVDNNGPTLNVSLNLFCKIIDQNATDSDRNLSDNKPLPKPLVEKTENMLYEHINDLIRTSTQTNCDFLRVKEKLYRFNFKQYSRFKNNVLQAMQPKISVTVTGQK